MFFKKKKLDSKLKIFGFFTTIVVFCLLVYNQTNQVSSQSNLSSKAIPGNSNSIQISEAIKKIRLTQLNFLSDQNIISFKENESSSYLCSFENYNSEFNTYSKNFYLYKNKEGYFIANFLLLSIIDSSLICIDKKSSPSDLEEINKNKILFQQRLNRLKNIFIQTQELLIGVLKKIENSSNKTEINNLITRIQTVTPEFPAFKENNVLRESLGCELPNAKYQFESHSIRICSQLLNFPEATIIQIMAHELSHAIDPCTLSFAFSKHNNKSYYQVDVPEFLGGFEDEPISKSSQIKEISYKLNPFNQALSCLQKSDSFNVAVQSKDSILKFLKDKELDGENIEFLLGAVSEHYEEIKYCNYFDEKNNKMSEVFADWLSAKALELRLQKITDPREARVFAYESQLLLLSLGSAKLQESSLNFANTLDKSFVENCSPLQDHIELIKTDGDSTHPKLKDRFNRLFLANESIQKALFCKPQTFVNGSECH